MKRVLDPERRAAIAERLRFYRDLGVYDFYRRAVPPDASEIGVPKTRPASRPGRSKMPRCSKMKIRGKRQFLG